MPLGCLRLLAADALVWFQIWPTIDELLLLLVPLHRHMLLSRVVSVITRAGISLGPHSPFCQGPKSAFLVHGSGGSESKPSVRSIVMGLWV